MFISIIIPTYKRVRDLKFSLDSICKQSVLPNETIIVDQSPDQETQKLCENQKYKKIGIRYFHRDDPSSARARNQGIEELNKKSELVLFFDDDVEVDPKYTEQIILFLNKHPNALGGGGQEINNNKEKRSIGSYIFDNHYTRGYTITIDAQQKSINKISHISAMAGCTMFFRKKILDKGYRFPNWMDRYSFEDIFLAYSIVKDYPGTLYYLPNAKIVHNESISARIPSNQRLKQGLCHIFYFYYIFDFSIFRFYWRSLGYFLHHFRVNYRLFFNLFFIFMKTYCYLFLNKKNIKINPSLMNSFIYSK